MKQTFVIFALIAIFGYKSLASPVHHYQHHQPQHQHEETQHFEIQHHQHHEEPQHYEVQHHHHHVPHHHEKPAAETLHYDAKVNHDHYHYAVHTSNGLMFQEHGYLKNHGSKDEGIAVKGSYAYVGDDGKTYEVHYVADENGFQPQGAHLPVAPEPLH